jgi:hypothetical protein
MHKFYLQVAQHAGHSKLFNVTRYGGGYVWLLTLLVHVELVRQNWYNAV